MFVEVMKYYVKHDISYLMLF